ncbi:hypothetical protein [Celeribacter sp. ULVN23_4]
MMVSKGGLAHRGGATTLALILCVTVSEAAKGQEAPLLQCKFSNEKYVSLTADAAGVTYRFGRPGQMPELELNRPYSEVVVTPWPGVGGSIWEELRLKNGDINYVLWGDFDRMSEAHDVRAGIVVERSGEELARLDCLPETIDYTVFGFADAYEAAGYCWDFDEDAWQEVCE